MDEIAASPAPPLPPALAAAWGLRDRPTKGPKPGLNLERILEAGVHVADTEGLGAVSMSRVAAELGAAPMSLYRHVGSKDELLLLMIDLAIGDPPAAPRQQAWRDGLAGWAWAIRAAYFRHLWSLQVPITAPPATPRQIAWLEAGLAALAGTGLDEQDKLSTVLLLSGFVRNEVTLMSNIAAAPDPDAVFSHYRSLLERLVDPARFPHVHRAIVSGHLDDGDDPDQEFVFGLERTLDGIAQLIDARMP
jgi:AcrR family transcriptional regulator